MIIQIKMPRTVEAINRYHLEGPDSTVQERMQAFRERINRKIQQEGVCGFYSSTLGRIIMGDLSNSTIGIHQLIDPTTTWLSVSTQTLTVDITVPQQVF